VPCSVCAVEVRLLGELAVVDGGVDITPRGRKQRLLIACLALHPGESVPVDQLAEVLWGDAPPANPANALQAQVASVRRVLPRGTLVTRGVGYALEIAPDDVDVSRFELRLAAGRRLLAAGRHRDAADELDAALRTWRGPALAELAFEEFAQPLVHRLEEERLTALESRIEAQLALGEHSAVLAELEALCLSHPLREHLWSMRMVALYRAGRQAEALRAYSTIRAALVDELGVEPGPELREAEAMVLAHDTALAAPHPVPAGPRRTGNVPIRLDRFIGRDHECEQLEELLVSDRLVTLVGPGGVGKTRLATEVAARMQDGVRDGVWFVDLTPVSAGTAVAAAIAAAIADLVAGREQGGGAGGRSALAQLAGSLTGSAPVLVVDNCEHVIDEAAAVIEELLQHADGLRVLATSREALGVPGERIVIVPPLDREAAAELFLDRARRAGAIGASADRSAVIDQICERLDDLPLAIELAASRTRALSLDEIEARLEDRFRLLTSGARTAQPRQRTLRSVVDWSHDLLDDHERIVFARLAAFAQPARLDAIEAVVGDDRIAAVTVADHLSRLVEKSLVVRVDGPDGARYGQLQTLRLYATERLEELDDVEAVRERHARWFLDEARQAATGLVGADSSMWRLRIRDELGDLRRTLDRMVSAGDGDRAVELVNGLAWAWFLAGDWHEAIRWFDHALACPGCDGERRHLAHQWRAYFSMFADPGETALHEARSAYSQLCRARSPGRRRAAALLFASTLNRIGHFAEAMTVLDRTRADLDPADDWGLAMCDLLTAHAAIRLGDLATSEHAAASSARRFERVGDRSVRIEALGLLAQLATIRGDLDEGVRRYGELVERCRELDLPGYLVFWLIARGIVRLRRGDVGAADDFAEAIERSRNPLNTAAALLGSVRAAVQPGADIDDRLDRALALVGRLEHPEARRAAFVVQGLDHVDRGERAAALVLADRLDEDDDGAGRIIRAAIALDDGDVSAASEQLARWDPVREQAVGGLFGSLLAAEHDRLRHSALG
jgi:predicted ATPase/DNA-binding SARP family transcriptional activator